MKLLLLFVFVAGSLALICNECRPENIALDGTVNMGKVQEEANGCLRLPLTCKVGEDILLNGNKWYRGQIWLTCHAKKWYFEMMLGEPIRAITCKDTKGK
ncbi:unnamed protein product, partial [Mesorhabditis spiculigera]